MHSRFLSDGRGLTGLWKWKYSFHRSTGSTQYSTLLDVYSTDNDGDGPDGRRPPAQQALAASLTLTGNPVSAVST